jgi:hypothetical protein
MYFQTSQVMHTRGLLFFKYALDAPRLKAAQPPDQLRKTGWKIRLKAMISFPTINWS